MSSLIIDFNRFVSCFLCGIFFLRVFALVLSISRIMLLSRIMAAETGAASQRTANQIRNFIQPRVFGRRDGHQGLDGSRPRAHRWRCMCVCVCVYVCVCISRAVHVVDVVVAVVPIFVYIVVFIAICLTEAMCLFFVFTQ